MGYQLATILENLKTYLMYGLDIVIIWLLVYYLLKVVKNNSRTAQIFKGVLAVLGVNIIAKVLGLKTVAWISDMFINYGILVIIIVFQPEIRSMLERLGKSNVFSRMSSLSGNEKNQVVDMLVQSVGLLSQNQVGALITIEQSQSLYEFIEKATPIQGKVTAELLTSIFVTSTPLHDGAVIIEGDKIACAGAYFPPTSVDLPNKYGARHRAAIGISEVSDAVSICVSEETGRISITENGRIYNVNRAQLKDYLLRVICGDETQSSTFVSSVNTTPTSDTSKTSNNSGLLSKIAIRKQEAPKKKKKAKKAKKTEEVVPQVSVESDKGEEEASIKFPHHKVDQIKGYESLQKQKVQPSVVTQSKEIQTKPVTEKQAKPVKQTQPKQSNPTAQSSTSTAQSKPVQQKSSSESSIKPLKSTHIEFANVNVSPMGNNLTKEEPKQTKPESNTEVKDAGKEETNQELEQSRKIEALLEKTSSLDISKLMGDASIDSQINLIRNTSLGSKDKGDK